MSHERIRFFFFLNQFLFEKTDTTFHLNPSKILLLLFLPLNIQLTKIQIM